MSPTPHEVRRAAVLLGAAVGLVGISFGVVASAAGLSLPMACAMSVFVFTGASQFAAVGVLASGGSSLAAIGSGLLLGTRHIAYGLALHRVLPLDRWRRLLAAQLLIDESTAMATAQPDPRVGTGAFWWTGASVFVCWNAGTAAGAAFGDAIGDPSTYGLDAVFPAAFLALLAPHLRGHPGRVAAALGAAIGLALVPLTPAGVPVVAASAGALLTAILVGRNDAPGASSTAPER